MDTDMPTDTDMAMKDSGKRLAATTGVFWCCFAMPVMAQQTSPVITPIATPSGQNVSGAAPVSIPADQGSTGSDGANPARAWAIHAP